MTVKKLFFALLAILLIPAYPTSAAVSITGSDQLPGTYTTQMPGSATDWALFYAQPATGTDPNQELTDFSLADTSNVVGNYGVWGNTLVAPTGETFKMGMKFGDPGTFLTVTLGNSGTFDYSNFDVNLLYDAEGDQNAHDLSFTLASGLATYTVPVTDPQTHNADPSASTGRVATFDISGLSAGDSFTISIQDAPNKWAYLDGISFNAAAAPEPAVYALVLGGVAILAFCVRLKLA